MICPDCPHDVGQFHHWNGACDLCHNICGGLANKIRSNDIIEL